MKAFRLFLGLVLLLTANLCFAQYQGIDLFGSAFTTTTTTTTWLNSSDMSSLNVGVGTNSTVRWQNGYIRSDGTAVRGHYKTQSNTTNWDNFSTQGNYNPYNGTTGTRARDYSIGAYNYGTGRTIYTGARGGQYYINSNGNRIYVPKRRSTSLW